MLHKSNQFQPGTVDQQMFLLNSFLQMISVKWKNDK